MESHRFHHNLTDLIDEDDAGLNFVRQREDGSRQLLRLAVPHVSQRGGLQVDELAARGFRRCLGDHRLPATWRAVQQHTCEDKTSTKVTRLKICYNTTKTAERSIT